MERADVLLQGAIDLHAHGYPEFSLRMPPRVDNMAWARLAIDAGMRGFVLKSHLWPTTTAAQMIRSTYPDLEAHGSVTLNPTSGGLSPMSAEVAAECGAKIVWLPTWSARREGAAGPSIFLERMHQLIDSVDPLRAQGVDGISVRDPSGALSIEVLAVLEVCKRHNVTLASGHIPIADSLILAERAQERGVRFLLTHPVSGSVDASIADQLKIASLGGMIEHAFVACLPMHHRLHPGALVEAIRAIGAEHCVMTSDAIEAWNPPAPEILRMFIATMIALGLSEEDVHVMTHDNPAAMLADSI